MNLFSEDLRRNPYPLYDQMRAVSPVLEVPSAKLWMVFDYDSVKRVLNDHDSFSNNMGTAGRLAPEWLIFFDPPRHTKLRALIMRAFTPKAVADLEPRIRELAIDLLEKSMNADVMDFATEFAVPLPMMVIAEMIGVPIEDWPRFRRWSDAILTLSYAVPSGGAPSMPPSDYLAVKEEMAVYVPAMIERRRAEPKNDLLTRLVQAEVDGERLTDAEIIAFVQVLLVAGQETTANLINNSILAFVENPDQLARVVKERDRLPLAIEEILRYHSPVQWMLRATRTDVDLNGKIIPAGRLVLAMIGSANRDPKYFREPGRFDVSREPNPHIAFGHGIHFCIGAPLARLESRIALSEFLDRVESFELATSEPWEPRRALHVYGPNHLPVRFKTARQVAVLS